ncbi:ribulose-5-phosphate 4-epimerase/fuculose-1-phosphate aldolase [Mycolicibacterium sp. BK556]|uniref:class II aldolase/adducin family protein n=1 Tax=Mycobacteriaceae TaxID=1762 RepID=UPI00105DDA2E|nr:MULTISPECIES: class II aldolase/adducin family protein [Mycobacteriaceae]MBB3601980.1 ribulose-5-phosphate 4-epimerase/fuculose-1-phosphate aldolase [Mycolicibacterium sp. BK556]MBB3631732.1 ribulose-5-phosphate 4-epimerase/fuculose-1-phosphate aldolase [Mycolicibacterium sp. BK607]MBB3749737.1 ribulose-5-phosphate 4-epimerase/fuculose-1-phosphate aldolase [Mycolicibacterium sp. BK634]TDO14048.1 ribulose-5-phosphate 4-epimerase/fuculose-1-phosphate aldolase [Mycobacterium sp. BK086]
MDADSAFLDPDAAEPVIADPIESRAHRKRRLALAYRVFGAMGWGSLGDGHISARDPEYLDSFWLGRYGVPFRFMTPEDLVLVHADGTVEGGGHINVAAYYIHAPVHEARPDVIAAAHCHTPYGTPFSAEVTKLTPISQEACAFFDDHEIFDDEEVNIGSTDGGKRIAAAIGECRAAILRNHGLLTVGESVDAAVGYFLLMERCAEVQVKARHAKPISAEAARRVHDMYDELAAWQVFQWAQRTYVPDAS